MDKQVSKSEATQSKDTVSVMLVEWSGVICNRKSKMKCIHETVESRVLTSLCGGEREVEARHPHPGSCGRPPKASTVNHSIPSEPMSENTGPTLRFSQTQKS